MALFMFISLLATVVIDGNTNYDKPPKKTEDIVRVNKMGPNKR